MREPWLPDRRRIAAARSAPILGAPDVNDNTDKPKCCAHAPRPGPGHAQGRSQALAPVGQGCGTCTVRLDRARNAVIVLTHGPELDSETSEPGAEPGAAGAALGAATGAAPGDVEMRRLHSEPGMVVESHQGYGSFHSPSSNVNTRQGAMDESDAYLQSRPLLRGDDEWAASPQHDVERGVADHPVANGGLGYQTAASGGSGGGTVTSDGTTRVHIGTPAPPRFPKEKLKTLIALLWMVFNFILTLTSLAITHERVPDTAPLPDIVLDTVPTGAWALKVSEITIMVLVNAAFVVVLLHRHRFIVFRRIFLIMGLLYMMRSVLYFVTALPKPDPNYRCEPKAGYLSLALVAGRVLKLFGGFGLSINGQHVYCGDYIYSGHTVTLTMAYLVLAEYSPRHWWPLHGAALLAALTGVVMVLVARGHYTVDVLIAYYVTTRLFWIYHTLANSAALKEGGSSTNYLARLWWFPMFRYFERNVRAPVPRHYEWPLPWPRCLQSKRPDRTS